MKHDKQDKQIAVFGLFNTRGQVEQAIDTLRAAGFRPADMSALLPDWGATSEVAHEKHTKAPEGAAAGAATGGIAGGTIGLLVGLGALAIPGLGPLLAAGPIVAALAGAGAGGAVGTLVGSLIGMGIPEYEAKRYESFLNQGGAILAVHADDKEWAKKARHILDASGAHGVDQKSETTSKIAKDLRSTHH
ncbi:MAG TPA: hypothetical protein VFQ65_00030 [Kofleriaceae bacterium]|nr:hypothetical protein [Kofleriaceae bacterium]